MIIPKNQTPGLTPMNQMETCLFCGQPGREVEAPLGQYCNCPRRSHLNCLIRHIQFNRSSYCELCLTPFQNVQIHFPDRSCVRWLREDAATREAAMHVLTLLFLIVYLEYLSLLQLAVRYQSMLAVERYLLQFMMYFFVYVLVLLAILFLMFLGGSYVTFRRTTGHVTVIPLPSLASQPDQFASSGFPGNQFPPGQPRLQLPTPGHSMNRFAPPGHLMSQLPTPGHPMNQFAQPAHSMSQFRPPGRPMNQFPTGHPMSPFPHTAYPMSQFPALGHPSQPQFAVVHLKRRVRPQDHFAEPKY